MLSLGALADKGLLALYKIANLGLIIQESPNSQMRKWPHLTILADRHAGTNHRAGQDESRIASSYGHAVATAAGIAGIA